VLPSVTSAATRLKERHMQSTTIHLPDEVATRLLTARGWRVDVEYVRPGGKSRAEGGVVGTDFYWARDEALTIALSEEASGPVRLAHEQTIDLALPNETTVRVECAFDKSGDTFIQLGGVDCDLQGEMPGLYYPVKREQS
jgi:hypothetical protein